MLNVSKIGENEIDIEWRQPKSDGGSRLKRYHVYIKPDTPGSDWMEIDTVDAFKTRHRVPKLDSDKKYFFAVAAANEAGVGDKVVTDKPVSPKRKPGTIFLIKILALN